MFATVRTSGEWVETGWDREFPNLKGKVFLPDSTTKVKGGSVLI